MGDLDTDPGMMRAQQNADTPQTIERDETAAPKAGPGETDAAGRAAREDAKAGRAQGGPDQMTAVLEANRQAVAGEDAAGAAPARTPEERREAERLSLAQPGRSRL